MNKRTPLLALFGVCIAFGLLNVLLTGHYRAPQPWHVLQQVILITVIYWWYHNDKNVHQYRASRWLNIGVVGLSVVAVPVYLFLSRGPKKGSLAFLGFILVILALIISWFIGTAIGRYATH